MKRIIFILARPKSILALTVILFIIFWGIAFRQLAATRALLEMPNVLRNSSFVVDPGHGGVDGGANSKDFLEKEVNLEVAKKLQSVLLERGAKVVLTREQDISPGNTDPARQGYNYRKALNTRVVIIEENKPDVFLSIHVNANSRRSTASGSIVYYNKARPDAELLSETLQKHLNMVTEKHGSQSHKPKSTDFYILRNTKVLGVVVELGFMTNQQEKKLLKQEQYQWELVRALAEGLNEYLAR